MIDMEESDAALLQKGKQSRRRPTATANLDDPIECCSMIEDLPHAAP
jgi:hypothetical protein